MRLVLREVERHQHVTQNAAKLLLILDHASQIIHQVPGALFDHRTPRIANRPGLFRRRRPGQRLPHQKRQRLVRRSFFGLHDLARRRIVIARVKLCAQIVGDAGHALCADRLDPRLLDGLEHRAGIGSRRRQARMQLAVMTRRLESECVRMAADDCQLFRRHARRQVRHPQGIAVAARLVGGEADLDRRVASDRARGSADGAAQRFNQVRFAFRLNGHRSDSYDSTTLEPDCGNSSPKHR